MGRFRGIKYTRSVYRANTPYRIRVRPAESPHCRPIPLRPGGTPGAPIRALSMPTHCLQESPTGSLLFATERLHCPFIRRFGLKYFSSCDIFDNWTPRIGIRRTKGVLPYESAAVTAQRQARAAIIAEAGGIDTAVRSGKLSRQIDVTLSEAIVLGLMRQDVRRFVGIFGHGSTEVGEVLRVYEEAGLVKTLLRSGARSRPSTRRPRCAG